MAIFGYLYLNNGRWKEKQIIPDWWVKESTANHADGVAADYGYLWWSRSDGLGGTFQGAQDLFLYYAHGYRGQFIFVVPRFDMVVVFTAEYDGFGFEVFKILSYHILSAVEKK